MDVWQDFERHYRDLYRFAYRMLGVREAAEDVAQEALLRLARNGGVGLDGEAARRWLFVVARNLCLSQLRRRGVRREAPLESAPEARSARPNPAQAAVADERGAAIEEAIGELPPPMREVVILREYEGMNYAQIADAVGCSVGAVKSRLCRARGLLRERLQPLWDEER